MTIISYNNLPELREKHKDDKIVICSGSFDMIHAGHVLFLEDCKKFGDFLVTVVAGDAILRKLKGSQRPIIPQEARIKLLDSLKPIDYTVLDDFSQKNDNPLYAIEYAIELLKPDVYVINTDAFDIPSRRKFCEKYGTRLELLSRTCPEDFEKISTSGIIQKIKNLRD
jgi:rfaE bifunctional protein nucleotidyltransferase chain/domain